METTDDVTRMRIVGGDLALDFVNTRSGPCTGPPDDDILHSYDDLVAWARHLDIVTGQEAALLRRHGRADPDGGGAVHRRALRVRDDLDTLFRAAVTGARPSRRDLARLRDDIADAFAHAQLVPGDDGFRWCWTGGRDLARPLWPVVHAAAELLTAGHLNRIKVCAGCRFLFIDASKNRSRRWCDMQDCGTAEKVRRYVARRAATRAATTSDRRE